VGFALLGELVARLRGAPWAEALTAEILDPLGMTRTTTQPQAPYASGFAVHPYADVLLPEPEHDAGAMAPAGQLWTTAQDLARWIAFLGGRPVGSDQSEPLLAPATLEEMREPQVVDDRPGSAWTGGHGLGLQVWNADGERSFGHGGSMPGFLAVMRISEHDGDGVLVMANSTAGLRPALADDLYRIFADGEPRRPTEWVPAEPPAGTLDALGLWFWGPAGYLLRANGSAELTLASDPPGGRAARFRRSGIGTWVGLDGYFAGETLRIVRAANGTPTALTVASFLFTRTPYDPQAGVPGGVDPRGWRPER
jgi:hypothetical protein